MKIRPYKNGSFFHRFELSFCGYSNSGKTTLLSKIIEGLSEKYDVGYYKHDAHKFEMDHKGKDTQVMQESGAKSVLINDKNHFASINNTKMNQVDIVNAFEQMDFLLIEGHKFSPLPKVFILNTGNEYEEAIKQINEGQIANILAIISDIDTDPFNGKYPFYQREEVSKIQNFVIEELSNNITKDINALILTGGQSSRMKKDKGSLNYHGESQTQYISKMILPFCKEVHVSCRSEQAPLPHLKDLNQIHDQFPSIGPITGILSAQITNKEVPWLVIACDLPYLDKETIERLIKNRNPFKIATCFLNPEKNWPEPLCTIYEPKSHQVLMKYLGLNSPCPRKILFNSNIKSINLENTKALNNVNTPKERAEYLTIGKL